MTENAFAAAAAKASPAASAPRTDPMTGNNSGYDPLFGGGKPRPSIFNKAIGVGVEVTGIISEKPFDKQSRFTDEDENGNHVNGALKFWDRTVQPNRPTDKTHDVSGKANDPVMDTIVPLSTDYRDKGPEDDGSRGWYIGGKPAMDAVRKAIQDAKLTSREQMVGMRLTVKRTGKSGRAWLYAARLTRD